MVALPKPRKMIRYVRGTFAVSLLAIVIISCATAEPTAAPTPDIQATVQAQVQATVEAIPTATPDIKATVQAQVQATVEAVPTATPTPEPTPTSTPEPTPTSTPDPSNLVASIDSIVNAFQVASTVLIQKSTREGGLTVTEGMWKGRAVIGGNRL